MPHKSFSSALLNTEQFQLTGVWPLQGIRLCTASSCLCQTMIKLLVFLNKFCFCLSSIIRKHMSAFNSCVSCSERALGPSRVRTEQGLGLLSFAHLWLGVAGKQ